MNAKLFPNPASASNDLKIGVNPAPQPVTIPTVNPAPQPVSTTPPLPPIIFNPAPQKVKDKPLSNAMKKELKADFKALPKGTLDPAKATHLPLGVRFTRLPVSDTIKMGIPDFGQSVTLLVPAGAVVPNPKPADPNKSKEFFVEVSQNTIAGLQTHNYGPFQIK